MSYAVLTELLTEPTGAAWLQAPGERDAAFSDVYPRVSVAVQRSLRTWLPRMFFTSLERYRILEKAFPLLVYSSSPPYVGVSKYDFTYDIFSEDSMALFFRRVARQLPKQLSRVHAVLQQAGDRKIVAHFHPVRVQEVLRSVQDKPKYLLGLLAADAFLVNAFVNLGCGMREAGQQNGELLRRRRIAAAASAFAQQAGKRLNRLYGGCGFPGLGVLLLQEATSALIRKC
jgi:hypothetical protein